VSRYGGKLGGLTTPEDVIARPNDASGLVAIHYDAANGTGSYLAVLGTVCDGGGISIAPGDPWNDKISSTRHQTCNTIKHFEHPDFSGATETTKRPSGEYQTLTTLNNIVSGVKYYGPVQ
jgi:hypothetical protein